MKKEKATKQLRIYPSVYEELRRIAFKKRLTLSGVVKELAATYEERK